MVVDQTGQHAPAFEVDNLGLLASELHHIIVAAYRGEFAIRDRDGSGGRIGAVECREQAAMKDKFGVCSHGSLHTIQIPAGRTPQAAKRKWLRSGLDALPLDNPRWRRRHVSLASLPPVAPFDSSP